MKSYLVATLPSLLIAKLKGIKLIYLFGSHVSGMATAKSDIAVLTSQKIDPIVRWNIQNDLADELNTEIDLVDFEFFIDTVKELDLGE